MHTAAQVGAVDGATGLGSAVCISNPNLLDNAYWAKKSCIINQKGQESYTVTGFQYTIDRWRPVGSSSASAPGSIKLNDGWITIKNESAAMGFAQFVENYQALIGKTVTLSFLAEIKTGKYGVAIHTGVYTYKDFSAKAGLQLCTFTTTIPANATLLRVMFDGLNSSTEANLYAAKLELGSVQTLAHQENGVWVLNDPPPNYAEELMKCQRHFYRKKINRYGRVGNLYKDGALDVVLIVDMPVPMRILPAVSISNIAGFGLESNSGVRVKAAHVWSTIPQDADIQIRLTLSTAQTGGFDRMRAYDGDEFIDFDANL